MLRKMAGCPKTVIEKTLSLCLPKLGFGPFFDKKEKYCQQLSIALEEYVALPIHVYPEKE